MCGGVSHRASVRGGKKTVKSSRLSFTRWPTIPSSASHRAPSELPTSRSNWSFFRLASNYQPIVPD